MKTYTQDEIEDKYIGKKGTAERERYENEIEMFLVGNALREARQSRNLTQEELGKLVGVQKAQISRIENGKNLTLSTIARFLKALNLNATLHIGSEKEIPLTAQSLQIG